MAGKLGVVGQRQAALDDRGRALTASGGWAGLGGRVEDRALPVREVQPGFPSLTTAAPRNVTTPIVLRVSDAYAGVRVLADGIATLPLHVYRRTPEDRQPADDNAHAVQLLAKPAPGSTGVDLISQIMVHLNVYRARRHAPVAVGRGLTSGLRMETITQIHECRRPNGGTNGWVRVLDSRRAGEGRT